MQMPERGGEHLVARRGLNHLVELVVRAAPVLDIALGQAALSVAGAASHSVQRFAKARLRAVQPLELGLVDAQGRDLGGEPFELRPHGVRVADLARSQSAHERAAIRTQLDKAACLEIAQRFPDRRTADAELLGERFLAETCARRQVAVEDARLQLRRQLVDECPPFFDRLRHDGR